MATVHVAAICGSLRKQSFNRALIEASKQLAPQGMEIEILDIGPIPPYNMDLESDFPTAVSELKDRIRAADGMLIACPEHNFSFSGVLKNAIDWFSRPPRENCLEHKPVILQSASTGWVGGLKAQYQLHQVLGYFEMRHMRFPEVAVGNCREKFDEQLNLTDQLAIENITKQLAKFADFCVRG